MKHCSFILLAALLLLIPVSAISAIIHVPTDQPNIQAGIQAAGSGDTVVAADGIYHENVVIQLKTVVLASEYILDQDPAHITATVIDGSTPSHPDTGSCVIFNQSPFGELVGFTLTGGTGTRWFDVSDGKIYREGGGVLTEGGDPTIRENIIIFNEANDKTGSSSAGGGGIRCGFGTATISNNIIAYNDALYGGGVVAFHCPVRINNNIIFRNSGGQAFGGGGLWITSAGGACTVENNTIVENSSTIDGGGVLVWAASVAQRNNIIRGNTAPNGPQIRLRSGGSGAIEYNDIDGGWGGTGNIDADPMYANSRFHLDPLSPCVDAGNPSSTYNDRPDLGNLGFALPPSQGTTRNDMGAFGGPGALDVTEFNSVSVTSALSTIDYDSVDVNSTVSVFVRVTKQGFGMFSVDSLRFAGGFAADMASSTSYPLFMGPLAADSVDSIAVEWTPSTYGILDDTLYMYHNGTASPSPLIITLQGTAPGAEGDVNLDGVITSADIIYLVNYVFKGGPPPQPITDAGDANCDGVETSADVIYLVGYVFKGGPAPDCG